MLRVLNKHRSQRDHCVVRMAKNNGIKKKYIKRDFVSRDGCMMQCADGVLFTDFKTVHLKSVWFYEACNPNKFT